MYNNSRIELTPRLTDSTYRLMFKLRDSEKIEWMQDLKFGIVDSVTLHLWRTYGGPPY